MIKKRTILILLILAASSFLIYFFVIKNKAVKKNETKTSRFKVDESAPTNKLGSIALVLNNNQNIVYGIDRKNSSLIFFRDGVQKTVYEGRVKDYDIKENTAVLIDEDSPNKIVVINLNTNSTREIELKNYNPIISVALSDDAKKIYFLSNFIINTKLPKLNIVPINGGSPDFIIETRAQNVKYLKGDVLVLFVENHTQNKNEFILYDSGKNNVVFTKNTNSYQISPDEKHIALQNTNKIDVLNTNNLTTRVLPIETSSRSSWKDNNTLIVFKNDDKGVSYATLTIEPLSLSNFQTLVEGIPMQTAYGFIKNILFWQGYNENIYQTPFE